MLRVDLFALEITVATKRPAKTAHFGHSFFASKYESHDLRNHHCGLLKPFGRSMFIELEYQISEDEYSEPNESKNWRKSDWTKCSKYASK